ncbi:hypothetical protein K3N28_05895 [Glycomyces sp. TRM65418]|uniref:hypothetical protein n=1 Tax=Glycomyces sp. TRM65418 TaxID=2867006 RepID=UPI001CE564F3|nr:hypothetical protein [Glycomyces sp. TRM65418]MCC3762601.1 hypothetical protein [Glycomyces sp. TRM65418]QZD56639.1 hypothetical protein K3N28_05855 [Glycomyces sp. TRM65418]
MQQLQDAPTTVRQPQTIDTRARIASIELGHYRFCVDYAADDDGTQHFDLDVDGVHCSNTPICCISVHADGRITCTFNTDAETIGVRPGSDLTLALRDAIETLASLINRAAVLGDHGVKLTGAGHSLLRAVAARPISLHPPKASAAPLCHFSLEAL